jgi:hypothetical protein
MKELPEIVTVQTLSDFLGMDRSTVYLKIRRLSNEMPDRIESVPTLMWHGKDIEKVLHLFQSCAPQGQRVRERFGKVNNGDNDEYGSE